MTAIFGAVRRNWEYSVRILLRIVLGSGILVFEDGFKFVKNV